MSKTGKYNELPDYAILLQRIAKGDSTAENLLAIKFNRVAYHYAQMLLSQNSYRDLTLEPGDLVQEFFLSFLVKARSGQLIENFKAYTRTAMRNNFASNERTNNNRASKLKKLTPVEEVPAEIEFLIENEFFRTITNDLPEIQKRVVEKKMKGYKPTEIAEEENTNTNTVNQWYARARKTMQKAYNDYLKQWTS